MKTKKICCFIKVKVLLCICLLFPLSQKSQVNFTDSDLPIVSIFTNGNTINDTARVVCNMGIIYNGPGVRNYTSNPFNHFFGKISIEIRGSTSQQYPKKSYGFETQDALGNNLDTSLLGLPTENDWILYGPYPDKTLMRNEITYDMFRSMGYYDARYHYCELTIDGQYKGLYSFMERIKRDKNRLDIAKLNPWDTIGDELTGGYIIKIDKLTGGSNTFWSSPYNSKVKYLYHDPEDTELHSMQSNYIKNYVINFENTMWGNNFADPFTGYRSLIEVNSFVDFFLMQELGRTVDGYRSSSFLYKQKDSDGGLLRAGPMWDFNLSFGNADYCDAYDTTGWQYNFNQVCPSFTSAVPFWWAKLLQDNYFADKLKCRWNALRSGILHKDSIEARIDAQAAILNEAQARNFIRWPILGQYVNWNYFIGQTYLDEINYLKWWFSARSAWMDANLPGLCTVSTNENAVAKLNVAYQVFPNPVKEFIFIRIHKPYELKNAKISIRNILGQIILTEENVNDSEIILKKPEQNKGIYFLRVEDESGKTIFSEKLIFE